MNYLLRDIPPREWRMAKARAALEGHTMRDLLIGLLRDYGSRITYPDAPPASKRAKPKG